MGCRSGVHTDDLDSLEHHLAHAEKWEHSGPHAADVASDAAMACDDPVS